jgi:hypothetical protein
MLAMVPHLCLQLNFYQTSRFLLMNDKWFWYYRLKVFLFSLFWKKIELLFVYYPLLEIQPAFKYKDTVFQLSPSFSYVNQQLRLLSEWLSLRTMHIKWPINSLQIFLIKIKLLGQPSKHSFCTIWNTWAYPTQESIYVAPSNMNVWTM